MFHSVCIVFDIWWDVCGPYMCPGSPVTWISTLVETPTQPAGSFSLFCFWQEVTCLWSLHVSRIPNHTDLHPGRTVYSTSHFIVSVLFFTGSETFVVPRHVWHPRSNDLHLSRNIYPTSCVILSVLFLTGGETSEVPTSVRVLPSHRPPPW